MGKLSSFITPMNFITRKKTLNLHARGLCGIKKHLYLEQKQFLFV